MTFIGKGRISQDLTDELNDPGEPYTEVNSFAEYHRIQLCHFPETKPSPDQDARYSADRQRDEIPSKTLYFVKSARQLMVTVYHPPLEKSLGRI